MDHVLAIDQGTHASRALLFDGQGRQVAAHQAPVVLRRPRAGCAEQDAEEIVASLRTVVARVIGALPAARRDHIRACGLACQRSTVLAWRADGAPLSAAIGWQDIRGAPLVEALRPHAAAIRARSGLPLSAHYGASKLHWLQRRLGDEPRLRLGPLVSFLLDRLGDAGHVVDHSNAQRMQLLDVERLDWSPQLAAWFGVGLDGLPACRPVLNDYGVLAGYDIPLTAVCGDQNAAWHGSGAAAGGCALVNLGSGAFVLAAQGAGGEAPELLRSLAVSDASGAAWLLEGTVNGAGSALQWLAQREGVADLVNRLPGWLQGVADPPLFLNTVGGLGSPWWHHGGTPSFHPDEARHGCAERAVAVVESIVFLLQCNLQHMARYSTITRLRVSGGLSRLDGLCRKLADLSGLPVARCEAREASARGVAWLAAGRPDGWRLAEYSAHFEPQADAALRARYRHFVDLIRQLTEDTDGH